MRLDQELVKRGLSESRTEAQELISSGLVLVNGQILLKQTKQVLEDSVIEVTKRREFVSRGGDKLKGALNHIFSNDDAISLFCLNKHVLDVGSSTGGFTDCILSYGAATVDAVDVGTSQLHPKIKNNKKVISLENTDIRNYITDKKYDIVVTDLSFIPLEYVLDKIVSFGKDGTSFFLLIKPQFEVGKGNTKKGIVKDKSLVDEVLLKYKNLASNYSLSVVQIFTCILQGGDGNQEYFLYGVL